MHPCFPLATTRPVVEAPVDCAGTADCVDGPHSPDCLSRWLTDAEIQNGVVPSDDELIARANLMHAALDQSDS